MDHPPISMASRFGAIYPPPPRVHWAVLLIALAGAEAAAHWLLPHPFHDFPINLIIAAWPVYLCVWIRKIDRKSISLYWALAAFITGFLFSWILWIVVIFEIREDLLDHYNTPRTHRPPPQLGADVSFFHLLLPIPSPLDCARERSSGGGDRRRLRRLDRL